MRNTSAFTSTSFARATAVGVLQDSSPVIVGGGSVRVWRLADGSPLAHPLNLPELS